MKISTASICVLLIGPLSSCYYQPVPGYAAPGYQQPRNPGYEQPYNPGYQQRQNPGYSSSYSQQNPVSDGKSAHNQGVHFGIRDARRGLDPKYFRYVNLYNKSTQKDFGRGYMTGYRSVRPL